MSAAPVPMYNPDDNTTRMVPPERMDEANQAGWEEASKMISPQDNKARWIPKSRMDEANQAGFTPAEGATSAAMKDAGVTDYKPKQGIPFGHYGMGMSSSDVTPTQAKGGAAAIGGTAAVVGAMEALPAVLPHLVQAAQHPVVRAILKKGLERAAEGAIAGTAGTGAYLAIKKALGF